MGPQVYINSDEIVMSDDGVQLVAYALKGGSELCKYRWTREDGDDCLFDHPSYWFADVSLLDTGEYEFCFTATDEMHLSSTTCITVSLDLDNEVYEVNYIDDGYVL